MSNIDVVHTDHIKPAQLKTMILDILDKSQDLMRENPEEGSGWLLVNAAMALRRYHDILEAAYLQSLREGAVLTLEDVIKETSFKVKKAVEGDES